MMHFLSSALRKESDLFRVKKERLKLSIEKQMEQREYKLDFGTMTITIDGDSCTGRYQENGSFVGTIEGDLVRATWRNQGKEGLLELDLANDQLKGKWKQGTDEGPMRGRWEGVLVESSNDNDSNPFDAAMDDDPFGAAFDESDEQTSHAFNSGDLTYNLFISADANDRDLEISDDLVSAICEWATRYGVDRDDVIVNKVFDTEESNSFCECFIPLAADVSGVLDSLLETLYPLVECNFWIYWHQDGIDPSKIIYGSDPNWDLDSQDNLFVDTSDPESTEGEGYLAEVFSGAKGDEARSQSETLTISFNDNFEHLLPYEITLYTKTISMDEIRKMTQEEFDEHLEEFEENRSSFAFADCDDHVDALSADLKALEIVSLKVDGMATEKLQNLATQVDQTGDCLMVFFYVYEECDWEEMTCEVQTDDLDNIWFKVNWEVLGQLKYIDSIDILSAQDGAVLTSIYPCTDGASPGQKYEGKTFVMLTDGSGGLLLNATNVNDLDLSVFSSL